MKIKFNLPHKLPKYNVSYEVESSLKLEIGLEGPYTFSFVKHGKFSVQDAEDQGEAWRGVAW